MLDEVSDIDLYFIGQSNIINLGSSDLLFEVVMCQ